MPDYPAYTDVQPPPDPELFGSLPAGSPGVGIVGSERLPMRIQSPWTQEQVAAWEARQPGPRTVQEATAVAEQQARDAKLQQQLSQNAKVADAYKAVEAAYRYQGMRDYGHDLAATLAAGVPTDQAHAAVLSRHADKIFYNDPKAFATATKPPVTPFVPQATTIGGVSGVRSGLHGEQFHPNPPPPAAPVGARYLDMADQEAAAAEAARSAGDTESYQSHKDRADTYRSLAQPRQSSTEVSFDAAGKPVVTTSSGPKPTIAATTKAQETEVKYENATQLINQLQKSLRPEDVGLAGVSGEMILDRTLAQFNPKFANKERIENRTALSALRESLLRQMSDDPRFSNVDRKVVTDMLPSTGAFESFEDAQARMSRVRDLIRDRARAYATSTRSPIPDFAKSPQELTQEYTATHKQLQDAVAARRMTPEQAYKQAAKLHEAMQSAIERYH